MAVEKEWRSSGTDDRDPFAAAPGRVQSSAVELSGLRPLAQGGIKKYNLGRNGSRAGRRQEFQPEFFRNLHPARDVLRLLRVFANGQSLRTTTGMPVFLQKTSVSCLTFHQQ
jgi:hypothetical protein